MGGNEVTGKGERVGSGVGPQSHAAILRAAFDDAPVGVGVCDVVGRFVALNKSLAGFLGQRVEDILGRSFLTFIHPEDLAGGMASYLDVVAQAAGGVAVATGSARELRCVGVDGSVVWAAVSWTVTAPDSSGHLYGIVYVVDVASKRGVEAELAAVEERVRLGFHFAPLGMALVGLDGLFWQVNRRLTGLLGYAESELQELTFREVADPEDRGSAVRAFEQLIAGDVEVQEMITRCVRRDGQQVEVRVVCLAARGPDGAARFLVLQLEDLSADPQAGEAVRRTVLLDALTGLADRLALQERLKRSVGGRSLLLIDLDDFRRINDGLGHATGDEVLRIVAARLAGGFRDADLVARLGGDEFAVLVTDRDGSRTAAVATRVLATIAEPIAVAGQTLRLTASVGVGADPAGAGSLTGLLREADLALSAAKAAGKRSWASYSEPMLERSTRGLRLEADLHQAIATGALDLVYQPMIDLVTDRITGVEALCRWRHPRLGPIDPAEFIVQAERSGLIEPLTRWALMRACRYGAAWRAQLPASAELDIAVNISPGALRDPGFSDTLDACLTESGLPATNLILEITETTLADADIVLLEQAHRLRDKGVRLALDDFGTGHSSLARLSQLPIAVLKLDRSLTAQMTDDTVIDPLVRATVAMAAGLGLTMIAEGVETPAQLAQLRTLGCPRGQGNLLGRPQPAEQLLRMLRAEQLRHAR